MWILLSGYDGNVDSCVFASQEDCRNTVWTYLTDDDGILDSFQADELKKKRKISFLRRRKDVYKALGPGSAAGTATVLALGSLFTSSYKGSESHIDIHEAPRDQKIQLLIQKVEFLPFVAEILSAGKSLLSRQLRLHFFVHSLVIGWSIQELERYFPGTEAKVGVVEADWSLNNPAEGKLTGNRCTKRTIKDIPSLPTYPKECSDMIEVLKVLSASFSSYSANPSSKLSSPPSLRGTASSLVSVVQRLYHTSFKAPDVYGVSSLRSKYLRLAYTSLSLPKRIGYAH
ncbi:UNVERIFIED_CONTAM: O-fucosyltransferase 30 [Sesamum calycinum]|uniref:O-fucosyltransferase 30 n=1 Tax=Sesamum calycinum TaxID=2727403 RepID=A0AAW2RT03_9LAMI